MKQLIFGIRGLLAAMFALAAAVPGGATAAGNAAAPVQAVTEGALTAFQLVSPGAGWALLGQQLFWTDNDGGLWREITPPNLQPAAIRAASFSDAAYGWVVSTTQDQTGAMRYGLARTSDSGKTWQTHPLALFAPDDAAAMAGDVFATFIDAHTGWLVVKQATSLNFSLGSLFRTSDGGDTWTRLNLPAGAPVKFTNAQDGQMDASATGWGRYMTDDGGQTWTAQSGPSATDAASAHGLSTLSMATMRDGWAKSAQGKCQAGACVLTTHLMSTRDGGQSWQPVSLPGGQSALRQSFAQPSVPSAPEDTGGLRVTYTGQGFDSCGVVDPDQHLILPPLADMQNWYTNSPYRVWNLYIGGSSAYCSFLTRDYVQQLAQQGWLFIPTWVGPQAPCWNPTSKKPHISGDPSNNYATATNQGATEALAALATARTLGLTLSDLSGSIINYDVEYFNNWPDTSCLAAVKSFISGWSGVLHSNENLAGVYGAPCGQRLSEFVNIANIPDTVWSAWYVSPQYDPLASVWGPPNYSPCGFSNSLWTHQQRMKQYAGGHDETWNNVTFNIDSDVIDAKVAQVPVNCTPGIGQVGFFTDWYFGSQCVLKQNGQYPTLASIGLPDHSISSLRVGPYAEVTVCRGEFYGPPCQTFTSDAADLTSQPIGNDVISSAQISLTLALPNHLYLPITPFGNMPSRSTR